jgi:hypothetical protein
VTKLITPKALQMARDYFGCPNLNGMVLESALAMKFYVCPLSYSSIGVELELLGGDGTAGSHLEERLFFDSLMRGISPLRVDSRLTCRRHSGRHRGRLACRHPSRA